MARRWIRSSLASLGSADFIVWWRVCVRARARKYSRREKRVQRARSRTSCIDFGWISANNTATNANDTPLSSRELSCQVRGRRRTIPNLHGDVTLSRLECRYRYGGIGLCTDCEGGEGYTLDGIRHAAPPIIRQCLLLWLSRRFPFNSKTPFQSRACSIRDCKTEFTRALFVTISSNVHHKVFFGQVLCPFQNWRNEITTVSIWQIFLRKRVRVVI